MLMLLPPSPPCLGLASLFFCTLLYLFLTHPLRSPTQVAIWENHVFPLRLLRDAVWHLQPDHSHPAEHGLLCESVLSILR